MLTVVIKGGVLTISIGIETLITSIEGGDLHISTGGEVFISNIDQFETSFKHELLAEASDGATPIHRMFDDVANNCLENGELGIDIKESY